MTKSGADTGASAICDVDQKACPALFPSPKRKTTLSQLLVMSKVPLNKKEIRKNVLFSKLINTD